MLNFFVSRLIFLKLFVLDVNNLQLFFSESFANLIFLFHFGQLRLEFLYLLNRLPIFDSFIYLLFKKFHF